MIVTKVVHVTVVVLVSAIAHVKPTTQELGVLSRVLIGCSYPEVTDISIMEPNLMNCLYADSLAKGRALGRSGIIIG